MGRGLETSSSFGAQCVDNNLSENTVQLSISISLNNMFVPIPSRASLDLLGNQA